MSKTIPSYLRIHRGPRSQQRRRLAANINASDQFWHAYTAATGWQVDSRRSRKAGSLEVAPATIDPMASSDQLAAEPAVSRSNAKDLADAAIRLTSQLEQARTSLRYQEAELATRSAILPSNDDRAALAERFEEILRDAMTACGCDSAAMYLLDDDTRYLATRAVLNLPSDRLGQPPRELRLARADLEAFVTGEVTIENVTADEPDSWNCPEKAAAAICISINDSDLPIGTLWLYSAETRAFSPAEKAAGRLAAGQLAAEVSRAAFSSDEAQQSTRKQALLDVSQWQLRMMPNASALAERYQADGMIESSRDWAIGWHHWDVLPDGSLILAVAEAHDPSLSGAMAAAVARAALTSHTGYRHTPRQLLQRIGDTLWQTNSGDQLMSLLYARVQPESGEGEVAVAGDIKALIASRFGYRAASDGTSEPLGSHIDGRCGVETFHLAAGEILFAYGQGFEVDAGGQQRIGEHLRDAAKQNDRSPLAAMRRRLAEVPLSRERGAATLIRSQA